jgi:hypothetical protein
MRKILIECFSKPGGIQALEIMDEIYERMKLEREKLLQGAPSGVANPEASSLGQSQAGFAASASED